MYLIKRVHDQRKQSSNAWDIEILYSFYLVHVCVSITKPTSSKLISYTFSTARGDRYFRNKAFKEVNNDIVCVKQIQYSFRRSEHQNNLHLMEI